MASVLKRKSWRLRLCCISLLAASLMIGSTAAATDFQKTSTGRLLPVEGKENGGSRLEIEFGSGMNAGGDLFSFRSPNLEIWQSQAGLVFSAKKFTVTLDENALLYFGVRYRLSRAIGVRLNFQRTDMTAIAQAYKENEVELIEFDDLSVSSYGFDLIYELGTSDFRPFATAGLTYVDLVGKHDVYSKGYWGPRFGLGAAYGIMKYTRLVGEVVVSRVDITSQGIMGDTLSAPVEYENYGPHQLYALKLYASFAI